MRSIGNFRRKERSVFNMKIKKQHFYFVRNCIMQPASCRSVHQTACHFPPERAGILRDYPPCAGIFLSGKHRAAFSSFAGRQTLLICLTTLVTLLLVWKYLTLPGGKRFVPMRLCMLLIISGAVGNLIDRVSRNYVVDFIYFVPIDFPKFNVADIYITVGVAVLAVLLFFIIRMKSWNRCLRYAQRTARIKAFLYAGMTRPSYQLWLTCYRKIEMAQKID